RWAFRRFVRGPPATRPQWASGGSARAGRARRPRPPAAGAASWTNRAGRAVPWGTPNLRAARLPTHVRVAPPEPEATAPVARRRATARTRRRVNAPEPPSRATRLRPTAVAGRA